MAKRFTDSDKWKKLRDLPMRYKLLYQYICDTCDHAGIWIVDFDIARVYLDFNYIEEETLEAMESRLHIFDNGKKWYIKGFVEFQYKKLKLTNRAHKSVFDLITKYNLDEIEGLIKGLPSPTQGAIVAPEVHPPQGCKDMDKDKDKDKDTDKVPETENSTYAETKAEEFHVELNEPEPEIDIKPDEPIERPVNPELTEYIEVLKHLMQSTGVSWDANFTLNLYHDIVKDGRFFYEDFFTVIDNQVAEWGDNKEFRKNLIPTCLFKNLIAFEKYYNNIPVSEQPPQIKPSFSLEGLD